MTKLLFEHKLSSIGLVEIKVNMAKERRIVAKIRLCWQVVANSSVCGVYNMVNVESYGGYYHSHASDRLVYPYQSPHETVLVLVYHNVWFK